MSAEATTATGIALLTQDCAKALLAAEKRIKELEAQLEESERTCDLLAAALDRLDPDGTKR